MNYSFKLEGDGNEWTEEQIDEFMEKVKAETFDNDKFRGQSNGDIIEIKRRTADGTEETYVKEDGTWTRR